jgi:hypothetical protein
MLHKILALVLIISVQLTGIAQKKKTVVKVSESKSFYQAKLQDDDATYFTPENFKITNDGKTDVSDELQRAINEVKTNFNFGIVFIPEGTYTISKTIYIPTAVRVIGYGQKRPVFVLADNAPGFQQEYPDDKGNAKYMFWFTSSIPKPGQPVPDAGASTFYSAMSNVDLRIGEEILRRWHYGHILRSTALFRMLISTQETVGLGCSMWVMKWKTCAFSEEIMEFIHSSLHRAGSL